MATRKNASNPADGPEGAVVVRAKRARAKPGAADGVGQAPSAAPDQRARTRRARPADDLEPSVPLADPAVAPTSAKRIKPGASTARRGAASRRPLDEVALYQAYFKLQRAPFSIAPDPRALFQSERHREALAHLVFGVQGGAGGFVLLTGEIGAGKTTVTRAFLEQLPSHCQVAWILNPRQSPGELLASICEEFGARPVGSRATPAQPMGDSAPDGGQTADAAATTLEPSHDDEVLRLDPVLHHSTKRHVDALSRFLLDRHARGAQCVLIIDEAQNLSADVLEQLRLLTNLETHDRKLLQIVLIGQPELRTMLAEPSMEQLAQRIIARYHLGPLNEAEVLQYVRHRMEVAGLQGPLPFHSDALARIHRLTRGIPRRINLLCDRALLGAYAQGQGLVDVRLVDQAQAEVTGTAPTSRWAWLDPRRWGDSSLTVSVLLGVTLGVLALLLIVLWARVSPTAASESRPEASPPSVSAAPESSAQPRTPPALNSPTGNPGTPRSTPLGPQPVR